MTLKERLSEVCNLDCRNSKIKEIDTFFCESASALRDIFGLSFVFNYFSSSMMYYKKQLHIRKTFKITNASGTFSVFFYILIPIGGFPVVFIDQDANYITCKDFSDLESALINSMKRLNVVLSHVEI